MVFGDTTFLMSEIGSHVLYLYTSDWKREPTEGKEVKSIPMETNFKDIYIGKLIEEKVKERHLTYAEFARMIHCSRTSLYYIFSSKSIDVERLLLISKVLNYDFIGEVYLKKENYNERVSVPHIVIPFKDKDIDFSQLPPELLRLIKEKIDSIDRSGTK